MEFVFFFIDGCYDGQNIVRQINSKGRHLDPYDRIEKFPENP